VASILVDKHKAGTKAAQRLLRHKYQSTTEIYTDNIQSDMREIMNLLCEKDEENLHVDLHEEQKRA
jgi:site-specific recombinase XerD